MADNGTGGTVDEIVSGVTEALSKELSSLNSAAQEEETKAKAEADQVEEAETKEKSAVESYTENVAKLKESVADLKATAESMGLKAQQANAERKVAEITSSGGTVSVANVLELMKNQKEMERAKREAEAQHFNAAMGYLGGMISSGVGVLMTAGAGDNMVNGLSAGDDKGGKTAGLVALAGGAVSALVLGTDNPLGDASTTMIEGYMALQEDNPVAPGVEVKTIPGLDDPVQFAAYANENANGVPNDPYATENAGRTAYTGSGKFLAGPNMETFTEQTGDALTMPIDNFDVDHIIEEVNATQPGGLADSVSTGVEAPSETTPPTGTPAQEPQEDIPEVPDIPDVPDISY